MDRPSDARQGVRNLLSVNEELLKIPKKVTDTIGSVFRNTSLAAVQRIHWMARLETEKSGSHCHCPVRAAGTPVGSGHGDGQEGRKEMRHILEALDRTEACGRRGS